MCGYQRVSEAIQYISAMSHGPRAALAMMSAPRDSCQFFRKYGDLSRTQTPNLLLEQDD